MMNRKIVIKDELKLLHKRFLAEMQSIPSPLYDLVSNSKKGLQKIIEYGSSCGQNDACFIMNFS